MTAATGGLADFFIADAAVEDTAGEVANATVQGTSSSTTQAVTEIVAVDTNAAAAADATAQDVATRLIEKVYVSEGWWNYDDDGVRIRRLFNETKRPKITGRVINWELK